MKNKKFLLFLSLSFCLWRPLTASASAPLSEQEQALLVQWEKASFHGFEKLLDPITKFPFDGAPVSQGNVVRLSRNVRFAKTSPSHVAMAFFRIVLESERGFLPKRQAYEQASELMDNLESLETQDGFLYQWYALPGRPEEWPRVTMNRFVPSLENGFLDSALMTTAGAFPGTSLSRAIDKYLKQKDYHFFFAKNPVHPETGLLSQGFDVSRRKYAEQDYGILNASSRITAFIAILKDDVPETVWTKQERLVREYKAVDGRIHRVLASWTGGLAETLFPDEVLGGDRLAPKAFRVNAQAMIEIQRDKGKRVMPAGIWGFSNGEAPDQGRYDPMGVSEVAYQNSGSEFVTPYSVLLALRYGPREAILNLKAMQAKNPAVFGPRYGFADSLDPVTGEVNRNILALDKGMELVALGNFMSTLEGGNQTSKFFWDYLKKQGWEKKALALLKREEGSPEFQALGLPAQEAVEKAGNKSHRMDLLKQSRDVGTFYDPDRSKASYRLIPQDGRESFIGLRYDVSKPSAYSGLYVKLRPSDFSQYRSFHFRIKGNLDRGYPKKMKVEIKNKGQNVQLDHIVLGTDWQDVRIALPRFLKEVDEVAFVFDNAETGKNRRGEVFLDGLYFN